LAALGEARLPASLRHLARALDRSLARSLAFARRRSALACAPDARRLAVCAAQPAVIKQRSTVHAFMPTMDYEIGDGPYPVQRNRTLFVTSVIPLPGQVDTFRVFYGAADANVATAIVQVTHS